MKQIDQTYLRRTSWFGIKPLVSRVARLPPINIPLVAVARHWLSGGVRERLPIAAKRASYNLGDGSSVEMADAFQDLVARDLFWGRGQPDKAPERHKLACFEV